MAPYKIPAAWPPYRGLPSDFAPTRSDAAQCALDVLEIAGVNSGEVEDSNLADAHRALRKYLKVLSRNFTDSDVDVFRREDYEVTLKYNRAALWVRWDDLSEERQDEWRDRYLASRDHFRENQ